MTAFENSKSPLRVGFCRLPSDGSRPGRVTYRGGHFDIRVTAVLHSWTFDHRDVRCVVR